MPHRCRRAAPYREIGAILAHAERCGGPADPERYPPDWRTLPQVVRAYDSLGWIRDAAVHDGTDPDSAILALLADPEVVQVHSRNIAYGCFLFTITRAGQPWPGDDATPPAGGDTPLGL